MKQDKINPNNPYKDMPDDQFIALLEWAGFKVVPGEGRLLGEDDLPINDYPSHFGSATDAVAINLSLKSNSFSTDALMLYAA